MGVGKRIDISLFDPALKDLINASAKIFPITQNDIDNHLNPSGYEYGRLQSVIDNITYIYTWHVDDAEWVRVGADDKSVDWNTNVVNKPTVFPPDTHTHLKNQITDFPALSTVATSGSYTDLSGKPVIPTDTNQLAKTDVYTKTQVNTSLATKSDATHDHDGRYATPAQLAGKSDTTHNHDTAYQPVGSYASSGHNHDASYAVKSIEATVAQNTADILDVVTNVANGDSHSNITVLNQLTQGLIDAWNGAVTHIIDAVKHITGAERTLWNTVSSKADTTALTSHTGDTVAHVISSDKTNWNGKADASAMTTALALKADSTTLTGHTGNTTVHVVQTDKDNWNAKITASSADNLTNKTLTAAKIANGGYIADPSGNEYLTFGQSTNAVNNISMTNKGTGVSPIITVVGDDPDIDLLLSAKGTGTVKTATGKDFKASRALITRGWTLNNTGASYTTEWIKACDVYITGQYVSMNVMLEYNESSSGNTNVERGYIFLHVIQQSALGLPPTTALNMESKGYAGNIRTGNVMIITTQNDAVGTRVELWIQPCGTYSQLFLNAYMVSGNGGVFTPYENSGMVATGSLPAGTQKLAIYDKSVLNSIWLNTTLFDTSGNEMITFSPTASAANAFTFKNTIAGQPPQIQATGDDGNIGMNWVTKGTGVVLANGNPVVAATIGTIQPTTGYWYKVI